MSWKEQIQSLLKEVESFFVNDAASLEQFRIRFLGSKNVLKDLFAEIKNIPADQKKEFGQEVNMLKQKAEGKFAAAKETFAPERTKTKTEPDLTLPGDPVDIGSRHPVSVVLNQVIEIFGRLGFTVAEGPEIEDEWHNFTALNTPEDHPARDMTDTFYIQQNPDVVLRSQTSPVQIRVMETQKPPIRIIAPGRVYRNETITYKHHIQFHQV